MRRLVPLTGLIILSLTASVLATARPREDTVAPVPVGPFVQFSGRVLDDATNSPLVGALVMVDGTSYHAVSDATGQYRFTVPRAELSGTTVRLTAILAGFAQAVAEVGIAPDAVTAEFRLQTEVASLDAVSVAPEAASATRERFGIGSVQASVGNAAAFAGPGMSFPPAPYPSPDWNTESYSHIVDNTFLAAANNPLSTFSIDVDRASYSNIRRFLLDGELPPKDAVRIEEMVNYFTYDYETPRGEHPFGVTTELTAAPWREGHLLLRIGLASQPVDTANMPPSNLVFLLDVSGSMMSYDKLPLVKQSLRMLVHELRPQDRVAIVVYAGAAGLVLPSTPGNEKHRILNAIEALEAGGSTAGGEGLRLAYDVARENHRGGGNNRVILATDGDFNVGVSSDAEMIRLVEDRRQQGTFLTVLGFGTGNLQDSKMEQMADHGNGNYAYIDSLLEARKVLVTEMGGTLLTVAKDVKLQVEFNPNRVQAYRLIGYENRVLAAEDFNDDRKDAGELGAGHLVTALYEVVPVGVRTDVDIRGVDPLRYQQPPDRATAATGDELAFVRMRYKQPDGERSLLLEQPVRANRSEPSTDMKFAAAVVGFGMLLRDSEHKGSLTTEDVLRLAREGRGRDAEGYRAELTRLVEIYRSLDDGPSDN